MKAMLLDHITSIEEDPRPLRFADVANPSPEAQELLIKVSVCGVCHTELDEIEGRTPPPQLPVIPGHQVVGTVVARGSHADRFSVGARVGIAWIFSACGSCRFCRRGEENLCATFRATGRDANGGYAELISVHQNFAFAIPQVLSDLDAAPLLCAGAIGYRSLRLTGIGDGGILGLTGFGASAHLVLKMARHRFPNGKVYVFARSRQERQFALELGAAWAGDTTERSPENIDAIIDTTPVWKPIVEALANLSPGGRLVINAIRKEDKDNEALLSLNYPTHLWMEKEIKSVANVTRRDVEELLQLAAEMQIRPEVQEYALADANTALVELKQAKIRGAKVLRIT